LVRVSEHWMLSVSIVIGLASREFRTGLAIRLTARAIVAITAIALFAGSSEKAFGSGERDQLKVLQTDWAKRLRRGMGGAVWADRAGCKGVDHRQILI
jgi:hypothetical protein